MVHKCLSYEKTIKQLEYMHKTWKKYLWVLALQNGKIDCAIRNYARNEGATLEISTQSLSTLFLFCNLFEATL